MRQCEHGGISPGGTQLAPPTSFCELVGDGTATAPQACQATDQPTQLPMPVAGTVLNFTVHTTVASDGNIVYGLRRDGAFVAPFCVPAAGSFGCTSSNQATLPAFAPGTAGASTGLMDVGVFKTNPNVPTPPSPGFVKWSVEYQATG